jgi:SagB-type dehydrogenase family enzyme
MMRLKALAAKALGALSPNSDLTPELFLTISPFITVQPAHDMTSPGLNWTNYVRHIDSCIESIALQTVLLHLARVGRFSEEYARNRIRGVLGVSKTDAARLVDDLRAQELLVASDSETELQAVMRRWEDSGWLPAFFYHYATRDYPFLDYALDGRDEDRELMRQYLAQGPRPTNSKPEDGYLEFLTLPDVCADTEREITAQGWLDVFRLEPTHCATMDVPALSFILQVACGVTGTKHWPGQGDFFFKRVPSGGARHPTEVYLANIRVPGIPRSWYHYQGSKHGLGRLTEAATPDEMITQVDDVFPDFARRGPRDASVVFIITSVVERSMWRYRDSRSLRAILMDVGHVLNTLRTSASAAGIRHWVGHDIDDQRLASVLGLDTLSEPVLFGGAMW